MEEVAECNSIRTCFMRVPIGAMCLDCGDDVVKIVRGIRPWASLRAGRPPCREGSGNCRRGRG